MQKFPRVTDDLQVPGAGYLPVRAREIYRSATAELFEGCDRLTASTWFTRYCAVRFIPMRDRVPRPADVQEAGRLLASAIEYGWVEAAPGPRGGQGWRLTEAGRMPIPERPARKRGFR